MTYMPRLYNFLERLAANNNREWFRENREEFDNLRALWIADIDRLIAEIAGWDPSMSRLTARNCVFRIYRDTRFSLDKTPYKTFFSAAFSPYGKATRRACYYLHLSFDDGCGLYGGMWSPEPAVLRKVRRAIVDNIEEFEAIITDPAMTAVFPDWCGDRLKTVPKGYDRGHPQAALLRLKEYGRFAPIGLDEFCRNDWPERISERFRLIRPLVDFINYSIDE